MLFLEVPQLVCLVRGRTGGSPALWKWVAELQLNELRPGSFPHNVPIKWIKKNGKVGHSRALHDHKFAPYPAIHTQAPGPLKSLSQWETCLTKNYRITSSNCWSFMCVTEQNFLWNEDKNPCKVKKWIWILYFSESVVLALGLIFGNTDLDVTQSFFSTSSLLTQCFCVNVNFPVFTD